jgi:hypothetical protein
MAPLDSSTLGSSHEMDLIAKGSGFDKIIAADLAFNKIALWPGWKVFAASEQSYEQIIGS